MKRFLILLTILSLCLSLTACAQKHSHKQIAATTLPVYEITQRLCTGTDIHVNRIINENVSCLHEYTLQVGQMRTIEASEAVIISVADFETFLTDTIPDNKTVIEAGNKVEALCVDSSHEDHHSHQHDHDPHIWLDPNNALIMSDSILEGLISLYPQNEKTFRSNHENLTAEINELIAYGETQLSNLSSNKLVTFHDGFSYMAKAFDLEILHAIEEESGSEASASELIEIIQIVQANNLSVIFTERNGSTSAAQVISRETGAKIYTLDMAISGDSYFEAMYHNIDTLKEALQ